MENSDTQKRKRQSFYIIQKFEETVKKELLTNCSSSGQVISKIGVAVSGGADSTALLTALAHLSKQLNFQIKVVTINHNIRPSEETAGDADFVQKYCKKLAEKGYDVICTCYELLKGKVHETDEKREKGEEEAARFLRYQKFIQFVNKENLEILCLAHNQNDQLETLLMRFLQGSSGLPSAGIQKRRGVYLRPLISISRSEIEQYLCCQNIDWCTDKTNNNIRYFRNRIRNKLMPVLDFCVPGWRKSLLSGAEKTSEDEEVISLFLEKSPVWQKSDKYPFCVQMSFEKFVSLPNAIKRRLLYDAFARIGCNKRIPNSFITTICNWDCLNNELKKAGKLNVSTAGLTAAVEEEKLFLYKGIKNKTDSGFFVIIKEPGEYQLPCCDIEVYKNNGKLFVRFSDLNVQNISVFDFPFCIRSIEIGDCIDTAEGSQKEISSIFANWHVLEKDRNLLPVIQELNTAEQKNIAIVGSVKGYPDWLIKN